MNHNRRIVPAAIVGILVSLGAAPLSTTTAAAAETGSASCTVPDVPDLTSGRARTTVAPTDIDPRERWLAEGAAAKGVADVATALRDRFGTDSKESPHGTLARGLIGSTVDQTTRQLVVVVDPSTSLDPIRGSIRTAMARTGVDREVRVRVQAGCRSAERLLTTMKALDNRSWAPQARTSTFMAWVDPATSTVKVTFSERDEQAARAARMAFADTAEVSVGPVGRADRMTDGSPHFGGAAIGLLRQRLCTAGFSIVRDNGVRGGTTAGHCFDNGESVYSNTAPWGTAGGKANYPVFDMMFVSSSAQKYTNVIHTDPCCPSTRTVTGRSNPVVNDLVCASGYVTKAICGLKVTSLSGQLCDDAGCTYGLITAVKTGATVVRDGDSGAPVYTRPGSTTATIKGLLIGGGGDTMLAETISNVESHLAVRVATTPQT